LNDEDFDSKSVRSASQQSESESESDSYSSISTGTTYVVAGASLLSTLRQCLGEVDSLRAHAGHSLDSLPPIFREFVLMDHIRAAEIPGNDNVDRQMQDLDAFIHLANSAFSQKSSWENITKLHWNLLVSHSSTLYGKWLSY